MSNQTDNFIKGGSFLVEDITYEKYLLQKISQMSIVMIAKTTEDSVINEVLPQVEYLENHEFDRSVELLKEAGELGLLVRMYQKNMVV